VVVYEGKPGDNRTELYLEDQVVAGFPGDESVNGVWRLKAVDRKSSKVGTVYSFGLELTSRWD
jgi:subtilisin-like proprotein convertase family protein